MAKKSKDQPIQEEAQETPETGTGRVLESGTVRIPGPKVIPPVVGEDKKAPKVQPTDRTAQNAVVPGIHLNMEQNRMARLRDLSRTNRDVRWLLEQHKAE